MDVSLPILLAPVLVAAFLATASPGSATMAIARESMVHGRRAGILLALGVTTGSWTVVCPRRCGIERADAGTWMDARSHAYPRRALPGLAGLEIREGRHVGRQVHRGDTQSPLPGVATPGGGAHDFT